MDTSSPGAGPRLAGFIVGGIGLLFGIAGFVLWNFGPAMAAAEHARLVALPNPDAISLTDTPRGREVIIEGRVAPDQPVRLRNLVAYVKEEEQRDQRERERSGRWKTLEKVSPPLRLIVGNDGSVRVINENYSLAFARTQWSEESFGVDTRYSGLTAGEAVYVRGTVAAGGIEAALVGSGTRESYLAMMAGNVGVVWWLGVGFMALSTLMILIALVLFVTAARSARTPSR